MRCRQCEDRDPRRRYGHFLLFSTAELATHLSESPQRKAERGYSDSEAISSILSWHRSRRLRDDRDREQNFKPPALTTEEKLTLERDALIAQARDPDDAESMARLLGCSERFQAGIRAGADLWRTLTGKPMKHDALMKLGQIVEDVK